MAVHFSCCHKNSNCTSSQFDFGFSISLMNPLGIESSHNRRLLCCCSFSSKIEKPKPTLTAYCYGSNGNVGSVVVRMKSVNLTDFSDRGGVVGENPTYRLPLNRYPALLMFGLLLGIL
jgi:hypothetical protein